MQPKTVTILLCSKSVIEDTQQILLGNAYSIVSDQDSHPIVACAQTEGEKLIFATTELPPTEWTRGGKSYSSLSSGRCSDILELI